jgi:NAD-dependent dihydropyrimidine dehydrogenase PreA subunit
MAGQSYMGIPREKIPWAPKINPNACAGCGECLEVCPNSVFVLNEEENRIEVASPDNCVVLCDKCAGFCPQDAITFPDKNEFKKVLQRLREQWSAASEGTKQDRA